MDSKELCIYIERIRSARKISQQSLVENIVSIRQYRRYLNGSSDMPFDIFVQMVTKVGLKLDAVLNEIEKVRVEEYQYANKLYNLAVNYDYQSFDKLLNHRPFDHFIDHNNQMLYDFSIIIKKYYQKILTKQKTNELIGKLVNYPSVLQHEILTDIELLILSFLIDVSNKTTREKIVDRIFYIYKKKGIISGGNTRILIVIAAKLAKYFGILEEYDRVIDFCDIGLKRNLIYSSYFLNEYFYYYKSLAYYKLGRMEEFKEALKKCFNVLEHEGNISKKKKFETLINEDYDIEFDKYVIELYNHDLNIKN